MLTGYFITNLNVLHPRDSDHDCKAHQSYDINDLYDRQCRFVRHDYLKLSLGWCATRVFRIRRCDIKLYFLYLSLAFIAFIVLLHDFLCLWAVPPLIRHTQIIIRILLILYIKTLTLIFVPISQGNIICIVRNALLFHVIYIWMELLWSILHLLLITVWGI